MVLTKRKIEGEYIQGTCETGGIAADNDVPEKSTRPPTLSRYIRVTTVYMRPTPGSILHPSSSLILLYNEL